MSIVDNISINQTLLYRLGRDRCMTGLRDVAHAMHNMHIPMVQFELIDNLEVLHYRLQ